MQAINGIRLSSVLAFCLALILLVWPHGHAKSQNVRELKIMSWNIANLASEPGASLRRSQIRDVSDYLQIQDILTDQNADIVALQEIGSLAGARKILGTEYEIHFETRCLENATACESDTGDIFTAIAFRKSLIGEPEPFQLESLAIPHTDECGETRTVRGGVGVVLSLNGVRTWVLSVHMKASCRDDKIETDTEDDCKTLIRQYEELVTWIATLPPEDSVIVAGDFNRAFHKPRDSILNDLIKPAIPSVILTPPSDIRSCWFDKERDFDRLKAESRQNNAEFEARGISPWIYHPRDNRKLSYFLLANFPSAHSYFSSEIQMEGPFRLTNPGNTLLECDGSMKVTSPKQDQTLSFADAYPSDHCPLGLMIEY